MTLKQKELVSAAVLIAGLLLMLIGGESIWVLLLGLRWPWGRWFCGSGGGAVQAAAGFWAGPRGSTALTAGRKLITTLKDEEAGG